jgi:hypothetical protein
MLSGPLQWDSANEATSKSFYSLWNSESNTKTADIDCHKNASMTKREEANRWHPVKRATAEDWRAPFQASRTQTGSQGTISIAPMRNQHISFHVDSQLHQEITFSSTMMHFISQFHDPPLHKRDSNSLHVSHIKSHEITFSIFRVSSTLT